jgi:hypothetical protein
VSRTFRNDSGEELHLPTLGVSVAAGEQIDLDLAAKAPVPAGLSEIGAAPSKTAKATAEKETA